MVPAGYRPLPQADFGGGLNLRDKADAVDPREAVDLLNVSFNEQGAIFQRDGFADLTLADLAERPDSLAAFYKADGTRQLIAGGPTRLFAIDAGGTVVAIKTGLTRGAYAFARIGAPGFEYAYCGNGADTLQRWDGATWTAPTGTINGAAGGALPKAGALAVTATTPGSTSGSNAANRMIATGFGTLTNGGPGGFASTPSRWFASNAGQPEVWETDGDPGDVATNRPARGKNYGDLTPGDGEAIMGAVTWRELVFIFKETKFFLLWGESAQSDGTPIFQFREVVNSVGLASRVAVAVGRDGVYFFNRRGVYRTTGSDPVLLSDKIAPLWTGNPASYYQGQAINFNAIDKVRMAWHMEQLFVAVPTGTSPVCDRLLVYDTQHQWWTVYDIAASALAGFRRDMQPELHHTYATGPNRVGHRNIGGNDDRGSAISSRWRSGWMDFDSSQQKTIRETKVWGSGAVNVGFAVDYAPTLLAQVPVSFSGKPVVGVTYGWAKGAYATYTALKNANATYQTLSTRTT